MDCDGVLTGGTVYYSEKGEELLRFHRRDGKGIELLHQNSIKTAIISSENSAIIRKRGEKLKIEHIFTGVKDKLQKLQEIIKQLNIKLENVAYIGDDVADLEVMKSVGLLVAVADAVKDVHEISFYTCVKKGGGSAVREIIDIILQAKKRE